MRIQIMNEKNSLQSSTKVRIEQYIKQIKKIHKRFLRFIDDEFSMEDNYQKIISLIDALNYRGKKHDIEIILYLISDVSNNHHRERSFFIKIEKILNFIKDDIKNHFTNKQVFHIFKHNKRVLLYLIKEEIITIDNYIYSKISSTKYNKIENEYLIYFYPEIKHLIKHSIGIDNDDITDDFEKNRLIGENNNYICHLIRNDLIKEFIIFVNKTSYSLQSKIKPSIFETNLFLQNKSPSLIEYAAFFGSIQIFNYLKINGCEMISSIWLYGIHSNNPELIHLIEENQKSDSYYECFIESIKCHHNDIAFYILNNYLTDSDISKAFSSILEFHNYAFIKSDYINQEFLFDFIKFDYFTFFDYLVKDETTNVNSYKKIEHYKIGFTKPEKEKTTILFYAVKKEKVDYIVLLLANVTIDVNVLNKCKNKNEYIHSKNWKKEKTALYCAIELENIEIIKLLLLNDKIDVNIPYKYFSFCNTTEKTPLYLSIEKKNNEIIKLLLSNYKIDITRQNKFQSSLHHYHRDDEKNELIQTNALILTVQNELFEILKLFKLHEKLDINCKYIYKLSQTFGLINAYWISYICL